LGCKVRTQAVENDAESELQSVESISRGAHDELFTRHFIVESFRFGGCRVPATFPSGVAGAFLRSRNHIATAIPCGTASRPLARIEYRVIRESFRAWTEAACGWHLVCSLAFELVVIAMVAVAWEV
jgi:hypothetical protein